MNTSSLGSLVVSLEANIAQFEANLQKAESSARASMDGVQRAAELAKTALGALGVALSANAFYEGVKGAIEMMDNLDKLSQRTGVAVESLSAMKTAAKYSETQMDDVATAIQKLSKNMVEFDSTGKGKAAQAFETLGISVRDASGHLKSADQVMLDAAQKLSKFNDGAAKTTVEMELFGKAGANLNEFLKELAERGLEHAKVTTQEAQEAKKLDDNLKAIETASKSLSLSIAKQLLPSLVDISSAMAQAAKDSGVLKAAWVGLGGIGAHIFSDDDVTRAKKRLEEIDHQISVVTKQISAGSLNPNGASDSFFNFLIPNVKLNSDAKARLEQTLRDLNDEKNRILQQLKASSPAPAASAPNGDLEVVDVEKGNKAESILKARLEAYLALENRVIAAEQQLINDRNKMLDRYYGDNLVSIDAYYKAKQTVEGEYLQKTLADYDKEIAALKKFQQQASGDNATTDRINAQKQITEILEKRNQIEQQVAAANNENALKRIKDEEAYKKLIDDVNSKVIALSGNLAAAAKISFDDQHKSMRERFAAEGDSRMLAQVDILERHAVAQAEINDLEQKARDIKEQEAIVEARIQLSLQSGAISELESMRQLETARQQAVKDLQAIDSGITTIAQRDGFADLVLQSENFRLALDQLRGQVDLTAQKFDQIFTSSFSSAFSDAISGTKSLSDAFRSMADDIVRQIDRIAAEEVAKNIFGDSKSGVGTLFENIFSGNGFNLTKMATTSEGVQYDPTDYNALNNLTGGSSSSSWFNSLLNMVPHLDVGTDYVPNDMLAMIHKGERIIPASENKGSSSTTPITQHITFVVQGQVNQETQSQIAARMASAVQRANLRNN
jgi:hypothetical protein